MIPTHLQLLVHCHACSKCQLHARVDLITLRHRNLVIVVRV